MVYNIHRCLRRYVKIITLQSQRFKTYRVSRIPLVIQNNFSNTHYCHFLSHKTALIIALNYTKNNYINSRWNNNPPKPWWRWETSVLHVLPDYPTKLFHNTERRRQYLLPYYVALCCSVSACVRSKAPFTLLASHVQRSLWF